MKHRNKYFFLTIFVFLILFLTALIASTDKTIAAFGISPDKLIFKFTNNSPQTKKIFVHNFNPEQTVFFVTSNSKKTVHIYPDTISLQPTEIGEIYVQITKPNYQKFEILISSLPEKNSNLTFSSQISVPVQVLNHQLWLQIIFFILTLLTVTQTIVIHRK